LVAENFAENFEDAVMVSRAAVDRGLMMCRVRSAYFIDEDEFDLT
jgi:hypothetical protein